MTRLHPLITLARLTATDAMRHDSVAANACRAGARQLINPDSNRVSQCLGHAKFELGFIGLGLWVETEAHPIPGVKS